MVYSEQACMIPGLRPQSQTLCYHTHAHHTLSVTHSATPNHATPHHAGVCGVRVAASTGQAPGTSRRDAGIPTSPGRAHMQGSGTDWALHKHGHPAECFRGCSRHSYATGALAYAWCLALNYAHGPMCACGTTCSVTHVCMGHTGR